MWSWRRHLTKLHSWKVVCVTTHWPFQPASVCPSALTYVLSVWQGYIPSVIFVFWFFFLVASDISACANDTILLMDPVSKPKKIKRFCSFICTDQLDRRPSRGNWRPASVPWLPPSIRAQKKIGVNWGVTASGIIHFTLCDLRQSTASDILAWVRGRGVGGGVRECLEKTHLHYGDCRSMTGIGICRLQKFWGACAQVSR